MKYYLLFTALLAFGQERDYIAPCATINVNPSAGIFTGMGPKQPDMGRYIVSTRPQDSNSIDSNHYSRGAVGKSPNPLNAIIYIGRSAQCIDRFAGIQDSIFSFSLVDLPADRWERVDSLISDTAFTSHHKFLCFDFARDQRLSQANRGTVRGRLAGVTTIEVCQCLKDGVPCVW